MQGLSLGWGPGASLVLGLPKALPCRRARTPSQEGAGQARGAGPRSSGLAVGPGGWPPHSPSALVHRMSSPRGWPGIPGPRRSSGGVRQAPPAGLNTDALQSREPAPRPSACPLHCRRLRPLPLPARSLACGLRTRRCPILHSQGPCGRYMRQEGPACSAEGPCGWAPGPQDAGRRPLGALGHVPGSCWTQMASSQAQHRDSLRGKDMPRLSPAGLSCCHLAPASTPGPGPAEPGPTCAYPSSAPGMAFRTSTWQASPHPRGPRPAVSSTGLPRAPPLCGARPFLFLPGLGPWEPPDMASSPVVTATLPRTWLPTSPRGPEAQPAYSLSCERVKKAVARTPKAEAGLSGLGGGGAPRHAASTSQEWGGPHPQTAGPSSRNFPTPQSPEPNKHRLSIIYKTI